MIKKTKFGKKGQGLPINKIVITVLVILAVVAALIFWFKADILKYFRNLPWYEVSQEDEEIDLTELTDEQISASCPARIGGVSKGSIYFCEDYSRGCKKRISSRLLFKGEGFNGEIVIDRFWMLGDDHIGGVNNKEISLVNEVLKETGSKYEENLPSFNFIKNLDGARLHTGNWICRDNIV